MPRKVRLAKGEIVYHVLNRSNGRMRIFEKTGDYFAFEKVLGQACKRVDMRLLAYCTMPNHWHLVVWPRNDGDLSNFMFWLTMTHTNRWHANRDLSGAGHLYQGRFKSFAIQNNSYFFNVCRYVECNALRAKLVENAQDWQWCSLWHRQHSNRPTEINLTDWPITRPVNWLQIVNRPQNQEQLEVLRTCIERNRPYGNRTWLTRMVDKFGLESTIRPPGRPGKDRKKEHGERNGS